MQFYRPHGLLAGFHADRPEPAVPELQFLGEQWLPVNREIGWHQHEVWEFYQQLDGETRWRSHSARYHLGPGNFFAAAPGVQHQLTGASGKHHFVFAAIDVAVVAARHPAIAEFWPGLGGKGATRPDAKPENSRKPGAKGKDAATPAQKPLACIHLTNAESLETPFRQVVREAGMLRPLRAEGLRAAVDYLVIEATRLLAHPAEKVLVPMHPGVHKAKDLLERHSGQPWRLAELGRLTGLSPNHLVTLFVRDLGVSPHQYLLRQRVERAKHQLAHSDVAVADIAGDLGFASPQHFARVFAATAGCSASAWRARGISGSGKK